jgi:PIN domain nuclease of toxin-antitoxin system
MIEWALDASAVLAVVGNEPGADRVREVAARAAMSTVNVTEVLTRMVDRGVPMAMAEAGFRELGVQWAPFTPEMAVCAADLRRTTRHLGLSLGDRACLALGIMWRVPVLTADLVWSQLGEEFSKVVVQLR